MSNMDFHKDLNEILAVFGVLTPFEYKPQPTWLADTKNTDDEAYRQDLFRYLIYFDETNKLI